MDLRRMIYGCGVLVAHLDRERRFWGRPPPPEAEATLRAIVAHLTPPE